MNTTSVLACAVALTLAGAASAQLIEGFEHGNTALYTVGPGTNPNFVINGASAHTGSFGAQFASVVGPQWVYRLDLTTAPGNEYSCLVRFNFLGGTASNWGRVYVGVGASPTGTWSMVASPNTSQVILQNNTGYGFSNAAVAPATYTTGTWYQMRLQWDANGDMTVRLYDEAGTTLLATTPTVATGLTTPGGIALRGFTSGTFGNLNDCDDIGRVSTCPGTGAGACSRADWNEDGVVDFNDLLAFLNDFNALNICADMNGDGVVDFNDFLEFLNLYNVGC